MKMTKKKILALALAISLLAILSMGTLAWFNAGDQITNEFHIADSNGDGTPDFSVDVWETNPDGSKNQDGLTFEAIAPGDRLAKNPTVENTGDYDQWIRVYVTFDEFNVIEKACVNQGITSDLRTWLNVNANAWIADGNATVVDGDNVTYVYYLNYKLASGQTAQLFDTVTIPGEFEQADMQYVNGNFHITVKAEALQADNTGDSALYAFTNFWNK